MIKLTVLNGPDAGSVFIPANDPIVIGRGSECDVVLHDSRVSRRHCVIQREGDNFVVSDLRTPNGLFLNDLQTRIDNRVLSNGDRILFGKSCLQVELSEPDKEKPVTPMVDPAAGDVPSPQSLDQAADPAPLLDVPPMSLPKNWQAGMTVFVPRAKLLAASEIPVTATEGAHQEDKGFLSRVIARVKSLFSAFRNSVVKPL
jgi:pSer/pThr/pTyr-binding forkhead associated (FHA) protein